MAANEPSSAITILGICCSIGLANEPWNVAIDWVSNSPVSIYLAIVGPIKAILALNIGRFEP
jgi:hypothetical protein